MYQIYPSDYYIAPQYYLRGGAKGGDKVSAQEKALIKFD
jgi:hypothetical protein